MNRLLLTSALIGLSCSQTDQSQTESAEQPYIVLVKAQFLSAGGARFDTLSLDSGEVFERILIDRKLPATGRYGIKVPGGTASVDREQASQLAHAPARRDNATDAEVIDHVREARQRAAWRGYCLTREMRDVVAAGAIERELDETAAYRALHFHRIHFTSFDAFKALATPRDPRQNPPAFDIGRRDVTDYCTTAWQEHLAPLPWEKQSSKNSQRDSL